MAGVLYGLAGKKPEDYLQKIGDSCIQGAIVAILFAILKQIIDSQKRTDEKERLERLLQTNFFEPEDARLVTTVCEDVLKAFHLIERKDPVTELIAKTVIKMVQTGERDPARLKNLTIKAIEDIKRKDRAGIDAVGS